MHRTESGQLAFNRSHLNFQWSFLSFPLVRGQWQRYKPGLLPDSGPFLPLCLGSLPSLWLLHFPNPVRRSLRLFVQWKERGTPRGRNRDGKVCSHLTSVFLQIPQWARQATGLPPLVLRRLYVCLFENERSLHLTIDGGHFWIFFFPALQVDVTLS